ncbi:MAG: response regulator [Bacteroidota bacterium]
MTNPKVLIVEDNKINALVLKKAIEKFCQPFHVINDKQAFDAVQNHDFSLIFMDINLGSHSLDGEAIMKQIKAMPLNTHLPIFAVTSYAMEGDKERFLEAGFDAYFSKPIHKESIISSLLEVLGEKSL